LHQITPLVFANNTFHFVVDIMCIGLDFYAYNLVRNSALKSYRSWLVWFVVGDLLGLLFRICVILGLLNLASIELLRLSVEQIAAVSEVATGIVAINIFTKMVKAALDQSRYAEAGSTAVYRYDRAGDSGVWPPPPTE